MKNDMIKSIKIVIGSLILIGLLSDCSINKSKDEERTKDTADQPPTAENNGIEIQPQSESDTLKGSLKAQAKGKIGNTTITISYHSPAVRSRIIWGGVVAFDKVWVTGAHLATSIEFDQHITVGGVKIPSGKYALFTIPGKEEWTIIINKDWQQHLADDYEPKDDVVRLKVRPETEQKHQERLRYVIQTTDNNDNEIGIYWEMLKVSLPIKVSELK